MDTTLFCPFPHLIPFGEDRDGQDITPVPLLFLDHFEELQERTVEDFHAAGLQHRTIPLIHLLNRVKFCC